VQRIGVIYNPLSEPSMSFSLLLTEWLQARGLEVWRGVSNDGLEQVEQLRGADLLVALGGDGTVLRATRIGIQTGIPVLPVAMGRLSFMAELQPYEVYDGLSMLLNGEGWLDARTLLTATVYQHAQEPQEFTALNEVMVARGDINRTVTLDVDIYNTRLIRYHADGVLVATATGSTAYALAAGGPIIDPRSRALVLVPIAAHLTNINSLVTHEDATITLTLRSRHAAMFSADGRNSISLSEGDSIVVKRSEQVCTFARVHPPSAFYSRLTQQLRRDD
jgi:NAD+ kinase